MLRSTRPTRLLLAAPLAAALLVSACSSSTGGTGSVGSTGATSHSSSGDFPSGAPAPSSGGSTGGASGSTGNAPSEEILKGVVLKDGDLPSSWTAKPSSSSGDSSDMSTQLANCLGVDKSSLGPGKVASVDSDDYEQGNAQISSTASAYASQDSIDKREAILTNPKAEQCLSQAFKDELTKSLPASAQAGAMPVTIDAQPSGLPSSVKAVATAKTSVTASGQTLSLELRFAFISGDLLTASVGYVTVGAPVDESAWTAAVSAVAGRAASA